MTAFAGFAFREEDFFPAFPADADEGFTRRSECDLVGHLRGCLISFLGCYGSDRSEGTRYRTSRGCPRLEVERPQVLDLLKDVSDGSTGAQPDG